MVFASERNKRTTPIKRLIAFERTALKAGESKDKI
ncbi:MAG: fibronectin type III-like domain-contianing protein [Chitinophagaceae bacterium]|nr:fibronectin type III-like domain-contianing protein [Chitinophagaceae bacterium]